jgi:hypothetical protein
MVNSENQPCVDALKKRSFKSHDFTSVNAVSVANKPATSWLAHDTPVGEKGVETYRALAHMKGQGP